jgi:hypothetical protein
LLRVTAVLDGAARRRNMARFSSALLVATAAALALAACD